MKRPRSGIIGTGFMGAVHARAVRAAGGVVSAVAASSRTQAEAMGASQVSESAAALIESDDVDVVHICTPNDLHASLGQLWVGTRSGTRIVPWGGLRCASEADPWNLLPAGHPQGYQDAFTAFTTSTYAAIDGPAPGGLPAFTDGLRAARLTAAVLESARNGDWRVIR